VLASKLRFALLLLFYFAAETLGSAALLLLQWVVDGDAPPSGALILVYLAANWPVRVWRSLLNACVLHAVLRALKRQPVELSLADVPGIRSVLTWKLFAGMVLSDLLLTSPVTVAQALLPFDRAWALVYAVLAFLLNWAFGFAQVLLFEDSSLSIVSSFVWSATVGLDRETAWPVFAAATAVFVAIPLVVAAPFLLVLQLLTFFEAFGFPSPEEICF
jgi:hypothetical protein